ncbi:MAG: nitrous oxide reductase accessory protein NosL [Sulfurovum sp.]|uniref:nitrous oxide reductase accessory protein NosL n=1 Tax=Sulfurovum sp. TaxID=1969726 RepID=UPI002867EB0A|nr:nitrous oxide reductase accessory protein NosL [Sulfurovum sp.]MCO4845169.1 nitrous oxide reductase accessory protein NosL [Sulfurovum sp.]
MKKMVLLLAALVMVSSNGFSEEMKHEIKANSGKKMPTRFQSVSPDKAVILQEGENKMYCPKCGMTLPMFYKTNHAAQVDGNRKQYCSIHCLAEAMADGGKVTGVKVVDNSTLEFIDVINSWYVVGSSKPGTMTMTSKYAFGKKDNAEKFSKEHGGKVINFYTLLDSLKKTLAQESAMVQKKQAMMAQKGEMMYQNMCTPFDTNFTSTAEAKTYLTTQKPCGEIKGAQLQAIGLYLNSRNK